MSSLQDRVEQAIAAGFRPSMLARAAGVSSGAVSQWRSGDTKSLNAESAVGLAALTGWSVDWWVGTSLSRGGKPPHVAQVAQSVSLSELKMLPQVT